MKRFKFLRNKYILSFIIFLLYTLFLDDVDVFNIIRQESRLSKIKHEKAILLNKYETTKTTLNNLDNIDALAKYAREKKLFKKNNEDLYVIVHKDRIK